MVLCCHFCQFGEYSDLIQKEWFQDITESFKKFIIIKEVCIISLSLDLEV